MSCLRCFGLYFGNFGRHHPRHLDYRYQLVSHLLILRFQFQPHRHSLRVAQVWGLCIVRQFISYHNMALRELLGLNAVGSPE